MKRKNAKNIKTQMLVEAYEQHVVPNYGMPARAFVRGKGTRVWDADGKRYLDFGTGIAVSTLGHAHPALVHAISQQAKTLLHMSNLYANEPQAELAGRLCNLGLGGKAFFCNSGAEANEALIKLARLWGSEQGGRHEVITLPDSFHGRTLATLTATGNPKVKAGFDPLPPGFHIAAERTIEAVEALCTEQTAAILVEPILGEGGVHALETKFVENLRTLCTEKKILLLFDEIQTGIGRTGTLFAYEQFEARPDAVSLAKGLGGGVPIGAIVTGPYLADVFQPGSHGSTFGGNPLSCQAALAVLDTIRKEHLLENVRQMGDLLERGLEKLIRKYDMLAGQRGTGLLRGLVFNGSARPFIDRLAELGALAIPAGVDVARFLPPLNVKAREVKKVLRLADKTCRQLKR